MRPVRHILLLLILMSVGACAQSIGLCTRKDDARLSTQSLPENLPEGCVVKRVTDGGAVILECADGREGFAFMAE